MPPAAVLVPIKGFADAKGRLAPALPAAERETLARRLAAGVVGAAHAAALEVLVATDDDDVAAWARELGASLVWTAGLDLNGSVAAGIDEAARAGVPRVVVVHADIPSPGRLPDVARLPGTTLVPDRRDDGTNVLSLPAACGFRVAYGPGSFHRHLREAHRVGAAGGVRVWREPGLGWDVDVPADLPSPA
ncbi:MAG TPA: 2-phospho-L-lactate guanylyltransferase [Acidimicrobiales bacterium]|nr:2-phospho-L-lactate guanylyltransferase [Acidimicrobiales bacterium]